MSTTTERIKDTVMNLGEVPLILQQYREEIKAREIDLTNINNEIKEIELNTEKINTEIELREAELLTQAKAKYEELGTEIEAAKVRRDAVRSTLADRQSILRELGDETIVEVVTKEESNFDNSDHNNDQVEKVVTGTNVTTVLINGYTFMIEEPLKGNTLTNIIKQLKKIDKVEARTILDTVLINYLTDTRYQRIVRVVGLDVVEEVIESTTKVDGVYPISSTCSENSKEFYSTREDRIYDAEGNELF